MMGRTLRCKNQRGLTLIEMLLATIVLSLVMGVVSPMLLGGFRLWQEVEQDSTSLQDLRSSLDTVAKHLRDADQIVHAGIQRIELQSQGEHTGFALEDGSLMTWHGTSNHYLLTPSVNQFTLRYFDKEENELDATQPLTPEQRDQIRVVQVLLEVQQSDSTTKHLQTSVFRQQDRYVLLQTGYVPEHAILCGGAIDMAGSISIAGSLAHVHTNGDLLIQANHGSIVYGDVRASGSITLMGNPLIIGGILEGVDLFEVPSIVPSNYQSWASVILGADGIARLPDGTEVGFGSYGGWLWETNLWKHPAIDGSNGTYYAETSVLIQGSTDAGAYPWILTLISEADIVVEGRRWIEAEQHGLLFLAGGNIQFVTGHGMSEQISLSGYIFSGAQIGAEGNVSLQGAIIADDYLQLQGEIGIQYDPTQERAFPDRFVRIDQWYVADN